MPFRERLFMVFRGRLHYNVPAIPVNRLLVMAELTLALPLKLPERHRFAHYDKPSQEKKIADERNQSTLGMPRGDLTTIEK